MTTCTCKYTCEPSQIIPDAPGYTFCRIIQQLKKPAAQHREEYYALLRARIAEKESGNASDIPYKLQKLGVPHDALDALRRGPRETTSLEFARRFGRADRTLCRTLLLAGARGVGKSTAAAYALWEWAKRYPWDSQASGGRQLPPAAWVDAREVVSQKDFGHINPIWLEGLKACEMLVVDDLGKDSTEVGLIALTDVLTARHEKRRATVITSNMDPEGLKQRYGDSWWARVRVSASIPDLRADKNLRERPRK